MDDQIIEIEAEPTAGPDLVGAGPKENKKSPPGVPWEQVKYRHDPKALAKELRAAGIFTYDDLRRKPNEAVAILQSFYRVQLAALLVFAREYEEGSTE